MPQLTPYQRDALNYKKHIALTANAGSGKTFVLSKRYIEIALNENISINKIVAITFTDKAAGELYKKIASEIDDRLLTENNADVKKKLERIRKQLVSANISTIHSFCIDLLREFSPDAGIDANFSPMDSETSDELIELSIEEVIVDQLKDENASEKIKYLIRILGSKNSLAAQLKQLIYQRKNILKLSIELYSKSVEEIAEYFECEFDKKFENYFAESIKSFFENLNKLNHEVLINEPGYSTSLEIKSIIEKYDRINSLIESLDLISQIGENIFTQKATLKKREFTNRFDADNFENEISEVEKNYKLLRSFNYSDDSKPANHELAKFGKTILEVFEVVLNEYEEKKNEKGYLDFEDILLHAKKIVAKEEVREKLGEKFEYIMLDEYQDTNEIQYEIFMPILEHLNKGNLFVVGDEKQSIYMFRDAELEIFNRTKSEIENKETAASLLQLPHSFRMSPPIAAFTNELFGELFKDPKLEFNEVKPSELICSKDENEPGKIEIIVADEEAENELVAKRILKLLASTSSASDCIEKSGGETKLVKAKDIAILCRKRNAFAELEKSFSKYKIPFTIIGGKGYYQRQIIYDVYNYLSFLINPENDSALVGILRSPFFSISDANIYDISLRNGETFFDKFKEYTSTENKFTDVIKIINEHLSFALRVDLSFLLRKILTDTNYWSIISSKPNSAQEIANLNKLLRISNSYLQQGLKTIYDFVNYLSEAMETLEDEGQASVSKDENTVKIMTIHQAKGLEYKAVFLYKCSDYSKDEIIKSKAINIDKDFGILTKVPVDEKYFEEYSTPPIAGIYNYLMNRKLSAEAKRLLYVAVTRAVNYLFISFSTKARSKDSSFINFIVEGLQIDLEKENFELNTKLKFMSKPEDDYKVYEKELSLNIPIVKIIEDYEVVIERTTEIENSKKIISVKENIDKVKNEIVSATKTAMFLQCPLKYKLTYDLGYSKILKVFDKQLSTFDFKYNEDEETNELADLRGRVIHAVLEKEIEAEKIESTVNVIVQNEIETKQPDYKKKDELVKSITDELKKYFDSATFNELKSFKDFQNEYEIYSKENDYYLYGIIDKLIITEKEIFVVDYKTDNIKKEQIEERGINYLPQLKFYALLVNKMFGDKKKIISKLIFVKHPDNVFEREISFNEIDNFKEEVNEIILKIRDNNFPPKLSHCAVCHYAVNNGKCVMPVTES